jgi:hypothetical protein
MNWSAMTWKNVFESDLRLPEKVCVLAPGPNGERHYADIPPEFYVIAVSKAVLIPEFHPRIWMMNHVEQAWYRDADRRFRGIRIFHEEAAAHADSLIGIERHAGDGDYSFTTPSSHSGLDEPLGLETFVSVDGCIRNGGTISAAAVQLAYNFGAREIILCGVDMSGDGYFDGTVNAQPTHGDTWPFAARFNVLIDWLARHRGMHVSTISPTKLDVPWFSGSRH